MSSLSVVILNHNYARFLPTAIASALNQTHRDTEVIVVDDASTDESRDVIDSYGSAVESVLHDVNRGQGAAINSGARRAAGQVMWFLDADDALLPEAGATATAAFDAEPDLAKFHTPLAVIDGQGRWDGGLLPTDPDRLAQGDIRDHVVRFRSHGWPPMSGNAYRAEALRKVLPIPEETYRQAADSFLNEQVAICGPIARTSDPVAAYRVHGGNQFAGTAPSLEWLRTKIERELCSHRQLGVVAWQLGLAGYRPNPASVRDVAFAGYRMASLRLDPAGHPTVDPARRDTRLGLLRDGLNAARTNPELPARDRVLRSLWFLAMAVAPSPLVGRLLRWYLPDGPSPPFWRRLTSRRPGPAPEYRLLVPPAATPIPRPSPTDETNGHQPDGE